VRRCRRASAGSTALRAQPRVSHFRVTFAPRFSRKDVQANGARYRHFGTQTTGIHRAILELSYPGHIDILVFWYLSRIFNVRERAFIHT